MAFCGLDCKSCPVYLATLADDAAAKARLAAEYTTQECAFAPQDMTCSGCASEQCSNKMCQPCAIRNCALGRPLLSCAECAEYPCAHIREALPPDGESRLRLDAEHQDHQDFTGEVLALTPEHLLWDALACYAQDCSWGAGKTLAQKMRTKDFLPCERVFAAYNADGFAGYCTFCLRDCLPDAPQSPYIGFVFVGEQARGHRLSQRLLSAAMRYAASLGHRMIYLVSDHVGLYEKYGFTAVDHRKAPWGEIETIFAHKL